MRTGNLRRNCVYTEYVQEKDLASCQSCYLWFGEPFRIYQRPGAGPWKCSSAMHWVANLSESSTGASAAAWEEWDTGVVECLLDAGVFPPLPMAVGHGEPR